MTKTELSEKSSVSISFLSDLTTGKGNPSLEIMEKIAIALNIPLSTLLEPADSDGNTLGNSQKSVVFPFEIPSGYERVVAVIPEHRAYQVKKWAEEAKKKLKKEK